MRTELDRLLASIGPEETIVETFNRGNHAINTFHIESAQIEKWDEFTSCMAEFLRHIQTCVLRLCKAVDISCEDYWELCAEVLSKVYGSSGDKAAFEMARTGNGGGLYGVLRSVAMNVAEACAKSEISGKVGVYLEKLSPGEQLEACSEYLRKHGHLLPSEMTEASAARIRTDFRKVLEKHPWLLLKIHQVGR